MTDARIALLERIYRAALEQPRPTKRLRTMVNALLDLDASDLSTKRRKREEGFAHPDPGTLAELPSPHKWPR